MTKEQALEILKLLSALDALEELQYATTDKAFAMADATIAALRERLGA